MMTGPQPSTLIVASLLNWGEKKSVHGVSVFEVVFGLVTIEFMELLHVEKVGKR